VRVHHAGERDREREALHGQRRSSDWPGCTSTAPVKSDPPERQA
jgi:hypothetical protein